MTSKQIALLSFINRIDNETKDQLRNYGSKKSQSYIEAERDFKKWKFTLVLSIAGVDMGTWQRNIYPRLDEKDLIHKKKTLTLRKKYHRRLNLLDKKGYVKIIKEGHLYKDIIITPKGYEVLNVDNRNP